MYTIKLVVETVNCGIYSLYYNKKWIGKLYVSAKEAEHILRILNTHPLTD